MRAQLLSLLWFLAFFSLRFYLRMRGMKKFICLILVLVSCVAILTACETVPTQERVQIEAAQNAVGNIVENQPVPTDIEYSLERYNIIKRAYWVNGQREKAMALPCAVQCPLGYIVLLSGAVVGKFVVDGKVSSLNSQLTSKINMLVMML